MINFFRRKPLICELRSIPPGEYHELITGADLIDMFPYVPKYIGTLGIIGVLSLKNGEKQIDILAFSISKKGQKQMKKYLASLYERRIFVKRVRPQNFDGLIKDYLLLKIRIKRDFLLFKIKVLLMKMRIMRHLGVHK